MRLSWTGNGWADYLSWQETERAMLPRINRLIEEAMRTPFQGTGKPEPLKGDLAGWWSRRITGDHRLVYRVDGRGEEQTLLIASCRYHYHRKS